MAKTIYKYIKIQRNKSIWRQKESSSSANLSHRLGKDSSNRDSLTYTLHRNMNLYLYIYILMRIVCMTRVVQPQVSTRNMAHIVDVWPVNC